MKYLSYIIKRQLFGASKEDFVKYPLFSKPADLKLHGGVSRQAGVLRLIGKLDNGTYKRVKNNCLCGNLDVQLDEVISRLDIHAIRLDVLLCKKCGLIRSADLFDAKSNSDYYRNEYRDIFNGGGSGVEDYFESQLERGNRFVDILNMSGVMQQIGSVAEIGCGCGGILYSFHSINKKVSGYDYDKNYLEYGRSKGMEMFFIEENADSIPRTPPDLLILSHVVEHFLKPKEELAEYIDKVRPGKYLLVEVPGIFCPSTKSKLHGYPVRYFQLAHVFQFFYRKYLEIFYKAFGLEIVYGDETATFVLKKPLAWEPVIPGAIFDDELREYPALIDSYLKETFFDYSHGPNRQNMIWLASSMMEKIGIRKAIKTLVRR